MASVAKKGNSDWQSEENAEERITYSCLTERVCCGVHKGEQAYVLLTPVGGYGPGAVVNAIEESGLRLMHMIIIPEYINMTNLIEEKLNEPTR